MKMISKILCLMLVSITIISFTGCSEKSEAPLVGPQSDPTKVSEADATSNEKSTQ